MHASRNLANEDSSSSDEEGARKRKKGKATKAEDETPQEEAK